MVDCSAATMPGWVDRDWFGLVGPWPKFPELAAMELLLLQRLAVQAGWPVHRQVLNRDISRWADRPVTDRALAMTAYRARGKLTRAGTPWAIYALSETPGYALACCLPGLTVHGTPNPQRVDPVPRCAA